MSEELVIPGKYTNIKIFTHNINEDTVAQILRLANHPFAEGSQIRIMPDAHIGKGAVVGTTMTYTDKVVPDVVGVDIGCGLYLAELDASITKETVNFQLLDEMIRQHVPSGFNCRSTRHAYTKQIALDKLHAPMKDSNRVELSIGSLGGGNHFIELNEDESGKLYLVIHSGSRSLGQDVAKYHQETAKRYWETRDNKNEAGATVHAEFAYLTGRLMDEYLNDVQIAQQYAHLNRKAMVNEITRAMNWKIERTLDTIHNYADTEAKILRKGAISAKAGQEVLIPINMRDGSILAVGKGNPDWNESAPHGAGRILSRTQAKKQLDMDEYIETMKNVFTTSVSKSTLDEAPFAYKTMEEILERTGDAFDVKAILKPLYNFKA